MLKKLKICILVVGHPLKGWGWIRVRDTASSLAYLKVGEDRLLHHISKGVEGLLIICINLGSHRMPKLVLSHSIFIFLLLSTKPFSSNPITCSRDPVFRYLPRISQWGQIYCPDNGS